MQFLFLHGCLIYHCLLQNAEERLSLLIERTSWQKVGEKKAKETVTRNSYTAASIVVEHWFVGAPPLADILK